MHIAYLIIVFSGITGIVGLFGLKIVEQRQNKTFLSAWRKKIDAQVLYFIEQCRKRIEILRGRKTRNVMPHIVAAFRPVYAFAERLVENKPMRLTGLAYNKGTQAGARVSRFLREVSKSKERDTVAKHEQRIES